jgi:signal transduction histidine kinase
MPEGSLLIVDDEESVVVTLKAILMREGYDVTTASTGGAALAALRAQTFDLVLTDLRLDDMDGLAILAEIRRRSPETVAILLTGYASLESSVKALREGAYDYLIKPCDVEELKATVARGIERRQLSLQLHARMRELEAANETIRSMNVELQSRVDEATAALKLRLGELERANEEIAALHRGAQRHVEQLKELDKLKSQFLSMASHELKTPLTVISGFLQVALRRKHRRLARGFSGVEEWRQEEAADTEQLEVVNGQTSKLARLVDELLDVSRIESGRIELKLAPVDLSQLAAEVAERMQLTTSRHDVQVVTPGAEGAMAIADRDQMDQVLTNLIQNAIKYSPDGGAIDIAVVTEGDAVTLSVLDRGVGIPASELDSVFDLFFRSRADGSRQAVGGMGLGLYISKEIVTRHGGRIWVESEPGQGSTFFVRVPRSAAATPADQPPLPLVAPRAGTPAARKGG